MNIFAIARMTGFTNSAASSREQNVRIVSTSKFEPIELPKRS